MKIEVLHVSGCPNVDAARAMLNECLSELQLDLLVEDREGAYPSPTIRVNGVDVMGPPASQAASCRLDVPTKSRLLAALRNASRRCGRSGGSGPERLLLALTHLAADCARVRAAAWTSEGVR